MRVLLLTYHYPPSTAVGALRAEKLVEAFRAAGHSVHVVTERLAGETGPLRSSSSGMDVETIRSIPSLRDLYLRTRRKLTRSPGSPSLGDASAEGTSPPHHVAAWKRFVFSLMWLPDDRQGFIPSAVSAGRGALRGGIDLLYTTAPPFSVHLAGLLLKRSTGIRWAAEFRDPWTDNPARPWYLRSRPADAVTRWLERECVGRADHLVAVSDGIHAALAAKLDSSDRRRLVMVRNGIEELDPEPDPGSRLGGPFRIVHAGSLYHQRDPFPFLRALAEVRRNHLLTAADVQVDFVGNCRWFAGVSVEARVRELNLAGMVRFQDWVAQGVYRRIIREADLLLLLANEQPTQVPNKLYDYLGTRRPILAFADEQGETARMLRQVGGHYLITTNDADTVERTLEAALGRGLDIRLPRGSETVLLQWTTAQQMRCLLDAVGA